MVVVLTVVDTSDSDARRPDVAGEIEPQDVQQVGNLGELRRLGDLEVSPAT